MDSKRSLQALHRPRSIATRKTRYPKAPRAQAGRSLHLPRAHARREDPSLRAHRSGLSLERRLRALRRRARQAEGQAARDRYAEIHRLQPARRARDVRANARSCSRNTRCIRSRSRPRKPTRRPRSARRICEAMGVTPILTRMPDFPKRYLGYARIGVLSADVRAPTCAKFPCRSSTQNS